MAAKTTGGTAIMIRRQIGSKLRKLRLDAGKTVADVTEARLGSESTIWRLENGQAGEPKVGTILGLCRLYGADRETTEALLALVEGANREDWWEANYGDVLPRWFQVYVGLEAGASSICTYDGELIHGLLQTADYARAVFQAAQPDAGEEEIKRHIDIRLERQRNVLDRADPASITMLMSAGVLRRVVGGPAVMAEQVAHLRHLTSLGRVDLRVLPWEAGAHAAMLGAFAILDFAEEADPPIVYIESEAGARYLGKQGELNGYRRIFDLVKKQTVALEEYIYEQC